MHGLLLEDRHGAGDEDTGGDFSGAQARKITRCVLLDNFDPATNIAGTSRACAG